MKTLMRFAVPGTLCALVALILAPSAFSQVKIPPAPRLDVSFSVSSLGFGVQAAKPLPYRSDIRGGFNFYTYNSDLTDDGINYAAEVGLKSVNIQFDKYLVAGLFVSGGALVWNGNKADAKASVPGGKSFSLGTASYISDPALPVRGDSIVSFRSMAPLVSLGYGNLTSRGHIAYTIEAGVAFHGTPQATLTMAGSACTPGPGGLLCQNVATPSIQNNVIAQQQKINDDISEFKYYPILQFSIGYKF
jgi:hypothetical protein